MTSSTTVIAEDGRPNRALSIAGSALKTLRLALPKMGVGWMFALLTINFNRITIVELNITAVVITTMLAMHYFLSPFQVITGRIADRHPIAGYRRTPYLIAASIVGGLIFLLLPTIAHAMGEGQPLGYLAGLGFFMVFGVIIATMGDSHHALIAESVSPRARGGVISVVWTLTILSTIIAAGIMRAVMPEYTPEAMQRLYNLTPFIVIISTLLGVVGLEKRLKGAELEQAVALSYQLAPRSNPLQTALQVLRDNPQARGFFAFIFVSILAIFLQDNILEPFGGEVFGMTPADTTKFQQMWGGGVLIGMLLMGVISVALGLSKRNITLVGCVGTAFGMLLLAMAAIAQQQPLITPALVVMGFFTGIFNVGALSMMMDMTVAGATGLYMGLWGMAQAFGNGAASISGGALHTGLIGSGLMTPSVAYFAIFAFSAVIMLSSTAVMWHLSVTRFHTLHQASLTRSDALRAMEAGASA